MVRYEVSKCVISASIGLSLAACASGPSEEYLASMQEYNAGKNGVVIMHSTTNDWCHNLLFGLRRVGDTKNTIFHTGSVEDSKLSKPAIKSVPPGKYFFDRGKCHKVSWTGGDLNKTGDWLTSIEVGAGEVIYPGTLEVRVINVKYSREEDDHIWHPKYKNNTYVAYSVRNDFEVMKKKLEKTHPEFAGKVQFRPIQSKYDANKFEAAITTAFEPDENGEKPTFIEAMRKLPDNIPK